MRIDIDELTEAESSLTSIVELWSGFVFSIRCVRTAGCWNLRMAIA